MINIDDLQEEGDVALSKEEAEHAARIADDLRQKFGKVIGVNEWESIHVDITKGQPYCQCYPGNWRVTLRDDGQDLRWRQVRLEKRICGIWVQCSINLYSMADFGRAGRKLNRWGLLAWIG